MLEADQKERRRELEEDMRRAFGRLPSFDRSGEMRRLRSALKNGAARQD